MDDRETTLSDDEIVTEPISPTAILGDGDTDATDATDVGGDSDSDDMDSDDQDADADDV